MKQIILTLLSFTAMVTTSVSAAPLVYEGTAGPGKGKHIVFLAGDHEYRSEESLPAIARLLARHHGFKCTVLFNVDPATGEIVAGNSNMPGMEALDTADLAVVFLRFQAFPQEQMKHLDAYLNRGGPVVGLRTATHAFKMKDSDPFSKYSYDFKGKDYQLGFGHQVLGQTWVGHYGTSEDITNEGYRRLVVNGCFWAIGLEDAIKPDLNVAFVGPFQPNTFGGGSYARGIKPEMYEGFDSPIPANNVTKAPAAKPAK